MCLVSDKRLVEFLVRNAEQQHDMFTAWLGPIPALVVFSPRLHELVLGSSKHINKSMQYKYLEPWLGTGLLLSKGAKWHSHRKLITPTFHFKILENFVDIFADKSRLLVEKFEGKLGTDDLDIFPYISRCTLDIICGTVIRQKKALLKKKNNNIKETEDNLGIKKKQAFLDLLLEASQDGKVLTDEEIREEVDTFMFEERVYEELNSIFQGSDRAPTIKDLNEMKYLERVIKEGLHGYVIPAGMIVAHIVGLTHYYPENFEDNLGFNPDHFLPEKIMERHPYAYIPFSAGPRNCIGQKFALLEEKTVLSYIIRNFKFQKVGEDPDPLPELIVRPETGIHLKLTKRVKSG
ncbi:Cytochrome P450 4c3 [Blattella germanica]|nr:Cytochrome P450 4c3 [Blattella germanica]